MSDFLKAFAELEKKQEALQAEFKQNRKEALAHIQSIINQFDITAEELNFSGESKTSHKRAPARAKYRLPNGEEWTGKGVMKKSFKEYFEANGLTKDDLDQFLI